jgi:hypothetical protein
LQFGIFGAIWFRATRERRRPAGEFHPRHGDLPAGRQRSQAEMLKKQKMKG